MSDDENDLGAESMDEAMNDLGAAAMRDDSLVLQDVKVRHAIFGAGAETVARTDPTKQFAQTMTEAAVTGKPYLPASGMTDEDVRRREHPEEYPDE